MKNRVTSIFFVSLCSFFIGYSQVNDSNYSFSTITTENGLSNNVVFDIQQDNDGFIWMATNNGLNRFDGYNVKSFFHTSHDSTSISSNVVKHIVEDIQGNLWIGTMNGLSRFNNETQNFEQSINLSNSSFLNQEIMSMDLDNSGKIWICTANDIGFFNPKTLDFELIYSPKISSYITLANNQVWIHNKLGEIISYNTISKKFTLEAKNQINKAMHFGNYSKQLWVSDGLQPKTNTSSLKRLPKLPNNITPRLLLEIDAQKSWMGTNNGLFEYDYDSKKLSKIYLGKSTLINQIRSIYKDNVGGIWVGTLGGAFHYDSHRKVFEHHVVEEEFDDVIMGLHSNNKGIYANALGKGIYFQAHGLSDFKKINLPKTFPQQALFIWDFETIIDSNFPLWMATNQGLICLNPKTSDYKELEIPIAENDENVSFSLLDTNHNFLWVATHKAIHKVSKKDMKLLASFSLNALIKYSGIQKIVALGDYIFIATEGEGLFSFHKKSHKISAISLKDSNQKLGAPIWDLFVSGNILWIGTNKGLYNLSLENGNIKPILEDNQVIFSIITDDSGLLWMGSDKGIKSFNPSNHHTRYYSTVNGLKNKEFNRKSVVKTTNGQLWFGGVNGISSFIPKEIKKGNPNAPYVHITNLQVVTSDSTFRVPHAQNKVVLPWEHNTIEIDYVGLNYTNTSQNKYKYKMEGHDPNWVNINEPSKARYVRLPVGTYTFKVSAANNDGKWNTNGAIIEIEVIPPFWRTKTAYVFYGLSLYGLILLFRRLKRYRKRITEVEQEKEIIAKKVEETFIVLNNKTKVYLKDLKYIKAAGNYLEFHTENKTITDRNKLKVVAEQLPPNFIRTHRSYIVNKNHIISANSTSVIIRPDTETPLSRTFKGSLS